MIIENVFLEVAEDDDDVDFDLSAPDDPGTVSPAERNELGDGAVLLAGPESVEPDFYDSIIKGSEPTVACLCLARLCRDKDAAIFELRDRLDRLGNLSKSMGVIARSMGEIAGGVR